jgi:hypothetical protein
MAAVAAARDARSAGLIPPDGPGFADAVAAARDRSAWPAGERAAPVQVAARGAAPPIRMRRWWFLVAGEYTLVVERARGGGFDVARVPSD